MQRTAAGETTTAAAFAGGAVGEPLGALDVVSSGSPDVVAAPAGAQVLHNRSTGTNPGAVTLRPREIVQLLCRDALDIGEAVLTMRPEATMSIDLGPNPCPAPYRGSGGSRTSVIARLADADPRKTH